MADVLKNTLVPEASALELVLRPAVEEQEIFTSLFMVDDKRVSAAHPLPLPVEAITGELVHILLAIGLLVFGYEEPNLTSLFEMKDTVIYSCIANFKQLPKIITRIDIPLYQRSIIE